MRPISWSKIFLADKKQIFFVLRYKKESSVVVLVNILQMTIELCWYLVTIHKSLEHSISNIYLSSGSKEADYCKSSLMIYVENLEHFLLDTM